MCSRSSPNVLSKRPAHETADIYSTSRILRGDVSPYFCTYGSLFESHHRSRMLQDKSHGLTDEGMRYCMWSTPPPGPLPSALHKGRLCMGFMPKRRMTNRHHLPKPQRPAAPCCNLRVYLNKHLKKGKLLISKAAVQRCAINGVKAGIVVAAALCIVLGGAGMLSR